MFQFEVINSSQQGKKFAFRDGLSIGDSPLCNIRVHHKDMQNVHARFVREDERIVIETAHPDAHIFINGQDVMRAVLKHHDEIAVGPLRLRVVDTARMSSRVMHLDSLIHELEQGDEGVVVYDFARDDLFYMVTKDAALRQSITFTIPSKDKFIDQAQSFLTRLVKNCSMDESQIDAFMTCAKELILNAHRHGHTYDETKVITLAYRDKGDRVSLSIADQGNGFDHRALLAAVQAKNAAQAARERYQAGGFGGLGFQLITRLSKDLHYNDSGTRVTFSVMKSG